MRRHAQRALNLSSIMVKWRLKNLLFLVTILMTTCLILRQLDNNWEITKLKKGDVSRFNRKVPEKATLQNSMTGKPEEYKEPKTSNVEDRKKEETIEKNPVKTIVNRKRGAVEKDDVLGISKNQACRIPKLDINESEIMKLLGKAEPLKCQPEKSEIEENWVFVDDDGKLRFAEARKSAKCNIRYFWLENDDENKFGKTITIHDGFKMSGSDYAEVSCTEEHQQWNSLLWDVNPIKNMENIEKSDGQKMYNVYILSFDSLSQMAFRRNLPKTVDFLENDMKSVVLNGYNIVGDGTPQAFIPILTAQTETELPLTRRRYAEANYVDDVYPFIWQNFSAAGYTTMYAEDMCQFGTFNYRLKGFRKEPTDHYSRPLFKEFEKTESSKKKWNCLGSIPLHKIWLQNARKFMKVYEKVPRFLLMHQGLLSHDSDSLVSVEDEDLTNHLKQMKKDGFFDDSVVIVMADHGHRFAKLRNTHQGQLEERMPFFSIALPESLKNTEKGKMMYKNLMENKEKLSSPFDIHSTLMDIVNLSKDEIDFSKMQNVEKQRSVSLFRPIPSTRNCPQAGIDPHWCTCLSWQDALTTPEDVQLTERLAKSIVNEMNRELEPEFELCAKLKLAKIESAKKLMPEKSMLAYKNVKDADGFVPDLSGETHVAFVYYQLKILTEPGNGDYEVTVFYDILKDEMKMDFKSISHVNQYGDTPHCIIDKNYFLATYCVCHDRV